jgi:ubiquinol-cytochrome c reductase cytochrome c1 subunit
LATVLAVLCAAAPRGWAEDTLNPPHWQSEGVLGSYDTAALQRGFLVYNTVCAACHSANALHYRDLTGLGLSTEQIAAIAGGIKIGSAPATLDDRFKNPYPDLSTIVAARPGGTRYVFSLLTGYADAPADVSLLPGHYYNTAYPGGQIAMPPPLKDGQVAYADGVTASTAQEASDVAAFLTWASAPALNSSKEIGVRAVLFLVFLSILAIATKRKIWRETV